MMFAVMRGDSVSHGSATNDLAPNDEHPPPALLRLNKHFASLYVAITS